MSETYQCDRCRADAGTRCLAVEKLLQIGYRPSANGEHWVPPVNKDAYAPKYFGAARTLNDIAYTIDEWRGKHSGKKGRINKI